MRRGVGVVLLSAFVTLMLVGDPTTAAAAHQTFDEAGEQMFTVPQSVDEIKIVATGAAGGSLIGAGAGGVGAVVSGELSVTPGEVLYVEVGGAPSDEITPKEKCEGETLCVGGFNGGGNAVPGDGAGGGGASDVRTMSRSQGGSLGSRLLVAGGGGGGPATGFCVSGEGGNAEAAGATGIGILTNYCYEAGGEGIGGGGGTQSKGGAGGSPGGTAGASGQGGSAEGTGGGGGGGLYGGGGGGADELRHHGGGGGGGGSNLVPSGGKAKLAAPGAPPEVVITYEQAPTVTTGFASEVTLTSATLSATVDPEASEVHECKFEYGTTTAYGKTASCSSLTGGVESTVSAPVTGLAENTTYHFRVVAKNAYGTSKGLDETFATLHTLASASTEEPSQAAEVKVGGVSVKASEGTGAVSAGQYGANPGGTRLLGSGGGGYADVYQSPKGTFQKIEFTDCELGRGRTLFWFNPEADAGRGGWEEVTRQTYIAGSPACIRVEAEASGTSPTLAQMKGTRYGAGNGIAAPEFGECAGAPTKTEGTKTLYEGFFTKNSCTVKSEGSNGAGTGKYEWEVESVHKTRFKTAASAVKLESSVKTSKITCTGESGEGEYTGQKSLAALTLKLTGCSRGAEQCTSADATAGEIVTSTLEGVLGWESITSDKVALALYPKTGPFMEFKCGTSSISVLGSVIAPVKANKMLAAQALKFKATKGKQVPESFEDEATDVLDWSSNGGPYEQMGLSATITQTNPTEVEINSAF